MLSEKQLKELGIGNWSTLAKDFDGADLLLGNGFSLNLSGYFEYKSLFEEFLKQWEPSASECKIFRSFGTNNFELIQESLINAKRVNKLLRIAINHKIDHTIELLKNGLIKSIRNTHPSSSQIDRDQLKRLSTQLNNFGDIFTLNYDLFLYHIIMQMKDESDKQNRYAPYSDYFWSEHDKQFMQFMDYDEYPRNHVYYLHGALFLFKISPDTLKLRRGDAPRELIEMIGEVITRGTMPLFVSEGKYKEKLKTIERSSYLSFCYESLGTSENKLVIFGSSLSYQDTHIANAINYRRNRRELAIAIHIGNKSRDELQEIMKRLKAKFKSHNIYFFDSETIFKF